MGEPANNKATASRTAGGPTAGGAIECRLLQWQSEGDTDAFESLVRSVVPVLEGVAGRLLRRHGIADKSAVDDAVSLVLDHLRRLRGTDDGESRVGRFLPDAARFTRGASGQGDREPADTGMAYVFWLIRDRTADVARARRREARRAIPLSELHQPLDRLGHPVSARTSFGADWMDDDEQAASVHEAIAQLDPRLRSVIELLLDGKSQASIATALHVCEGTVSRLRRRAIGELRRLLCT